MKNGLAKILVVSALSIAFWGAVFGLAQLVEAGPPTARPLTARPLTPRERVEGLVLGTLIGDALGGPTEFVDPPVRSRFARLKRPISSREMHAWAQALELVDYTREASAYGPFRGQAPAGTITDDSRHKILLLKWLRRQQPLTSKSLAEEYLRTYRSAVRFPQLTRAWLSEYVTAARAVVGHPLGRGPSGWVRPPAALWGGISTQAGQMVFLPLAVAGATRPERAYRLVWDLDWMDNGTAKDTTAAVVAGLAAALKGENWSGVLTTVRGVDPFNLRQVPWVGRPLEKWLRLARQAVRSSQGSPQKLISFLESRVPAVVWWEDYAPFVLGFAFLEFAQDEPLVALQLANEFGKDTDSTAQLIGAYIGAMHGPKIFPEQARSAVIRRLQVDFGESVSGWVDTLMDQQSRFKADS